jgi:hypothetical protein
VAVTAEAQSGVLGAAVRDRAERQRVPSGRRTLAPATAFPPHADATRDDGDQLEAGVSALSDNRRRLENALALADWLTPRVITAPGVELVQSSSYCATGVETPAFEP